MQTGRQALGECVHIVAFRGGGNAAQIVQQFSAVERPQQTRLGINRI